MKGKVVSAIMLILSFTGILLLAFNIQPVRTLATATVIYDYYVVARAHSDMMPKVPSPAPSPLGFNFTVNPPVFNFGNVTCWGGRTYLYDGFAYSPYTNMSRFGSGARVNITNLLGYDITITNLTAEVTDGTIADFYLIMEWFGNWTIVIVDTLDPGERDECNYTTGMVEVNRLVDSDRYNKIRPDIPPEQWDDLAPGYSNQGPGSLLEPDEYGDAEATNHIAPIPLANGTTFVEYFGVVIFGDVDVGTQINGTITLALTYEFTVQGPPVASFTYTPTAPFFNETVIFNASASTPNGGIITSYVWDFGDGTNDTGMIVNHTYVTPGNYIVILNVTDTEWLSTTNNQSIEIVPELPSFLLLPLFIITTLATVVYVKKRKKA